MKLFASSLRKATLSTHNEQIYKNTVPLPVKIYGEKACNYTEWRVAKTLKLNLVLAKAFALSHTPLSQTVTVQQLFQEFYFQQLQVLPLF